MRILHNHHQSDVLDNRHDQSMREKTSIVLSLTIYEDQLFLEEEWRNVALKRSADVEKVLFNQSFAIQRERKEISLLTHALFSGLEREREKKSVKSSNETTTLSPDLNLVLIRVIAIRLRLSRQCLASTPDWLLFAQRCSRFHPPIHPSLSLCYSRKRIMKLDVLNTSCDISEIKTSHLYLCRWTALQFAKYRNWKHYTSLRSDEKEEELTRERCSLMTKL